MAQEIVGIKVEVDSSDVGKSVGELRQEIAKTTAEVDKLSKQYGESSKEAQAAQKRLQQLQQLTNQKIEQQNQFIDNAAKSVTALSAAYGGVQGALELTGLAGEDTIKQLAKIQSALAIGDAVQNLAEFRGAIVSTFASLGKSAKAAFNTIKAGIGSTGIGLLVIAVGTLVAYWDDIKEAVFGVSEEQKKLNEQVKKNLEAEQSKLDAIGEQDNILKLQGKSEKDILNLKIAQTDQTIQAAEANLESLRQQKKIQVEIAERNKEILKGLLNFLSVPITAILFAVDKTREALGQTSTLLEDYKEGLANLVFDPKKVAEESDATIEEAEKGLTKLKNQRAGFLLSIKQIDDANAEKARQERIEKDKEEFKREIEEQEKRRKTVEGIIGQSEERKKEIARVISLQGKTQLNNKLVDIDTQKGIKDLQNLQAEFRYKKELNDAEIKLAEEKKDAEIAAAQSALNIISGLIDQNSVAGKAIAVVQAIINTYQGASKAIAQGGIFGPVAAAATIAAGLVQVRKIVSTKIPSAKGTGSVADTGGGGMTMAAAPIGPTAPIQNTVTQLDQGTINRMGSATSRAYVVESDITNSQEKITRINRAARLG